MSTLLKNLLFALGLAVILYLGYTLFLKEDGALLESSNDLATTGQAAQEAQEFLVRLQELKRLDVEGQIFRDQRFTSLKNFREELEEEETGRENPFAPVE